MGEEHNTEKRLRFAKMQGAGNDFVVLDGMHAQAPTAPDAIRCLAHRRFGIGCDQVLLLSPPANPEKADFSYRVFNNTGEEVEFCGNGARCVARYAILKGYVKTSVVRLEASCGIVAVHAEPDGRRMTVEMSAPRLRADQIPFDPDGLIRRRSGGMTEFGVWCETLGRHIWFSVVSVGNPHAILFFDRDINTVEVQTLGPVVQHCGHFPQGVNVSFVETLSPSRARIRTFERGSGETLACGTGTTASFVAGRLQGRFDAKTTFATRGGLLVCQSDMPGDPVKLTGDAVLVFEGELHLNEGPMGELLLGPAQKQNWI